MGNEHRLFQAMMEHPDDLDLRLVIADWYQEQGDPRGEFIQVQIALDCLPRQHAWRTDMQRREKELLKEHRKTWDAPHHQNLNATAFKGRVRARRGLIRGWEYRRGFVEHLFADAAAVMDSLSTFLKLGPLRSLRLTNAREVLSRLRRWQHLSRFARLDLPHNHLGDGGVHDLITSPFLENLESLCLVDNGVTDSCLELLTAEELPSLKRIVLSQNRFSRDGWERLLFHFGEKLEHENGTVPLTTYASHSERYEPEFLSYDDEILYDSGQIDAEGKRELDGEWVEGYDEYEGFEEFDEDGIKYLGGYGDSRQSDRWLGPNEEPDFRPSGEEEDEY